MKSVTQRDPFGCGIACAAFVSRLSYKNAKKLFNNKKNAKIKGYYCQDIVNALKRKKLTYGYCYAKDSKKHLLKINNTIVFIKRSRKYPAGHYLVYYNGNWMNPWINYPQKAKSGFQKRLPGKAQWIIYYKKE